MSNIEIGGIALVLSIVLIGFRLHVGVALALSAIGGMIAIIGTRGTMGVLKSTPYEFSASWELSAIPMFILMGNVAYHTGMTDALFRAARLWLGRLPGGLAVASNFASAGFAAASGSSLATVMSIGKIGIPEMLRYKYNPGMAGGVIAAAGNLGSLIPPSILLVLYGIFAEQSITSLFTAAIVPGILTALVFAAMIMIRCWLNPSLAPVPDEQPSLREKMEVLIHIWPLPLLVIGVMGSLYSGLTTATEAGALGAFIAFVIALVQGKLNRGAIRRALLETVYTSGSLFFIAMGAILMTRLMAFSGLPGYLSGQFTAADLSPVLLVVIVCLIYLVLGCVMDSMGMMLLTLPVMIPLFNAAGFDMIWFGIIVVKFVEIGMITPPLGINVFAVKTIMPDTPLGVLFRGVSWFLLCEIIVVALLCLFPIIVTFAI